MRLIYEKSITNQIGDMIKDHLHADTTKVVVGIELTKEEYRKFCAQNDYIPGGKANYDGVPIMIGDK